VTDARGLHLHPNRPGSRVWDLTCDDLERTLAVADLGGAYDVEVAGVHDLLMGATAIAAGYRVATRDRRSFGRIPGLEVLIL
jgi:predicted nucleic acid-binding protein